MTDGMIDTMIDAMIDRTTGDMIGAPDLTSSGRGRVVTNRAVTIRASAGRTAGAVSAEGTA
jgi:hypothetical protein